jgi:acyl carrier protein
MQDKLLSIFREIFNDPDLVVNEDTTAADVRGWDSFNHMNLIMAIEEEFSVSFSTKEIGQMGRVGDLIKLLQQKLA